MMIKGILLLINLLCASALMAQAAKTAPVSKTVSTPAAAASTKASANVPKVEDEKAEGSVKASPKQKVEDEDKDKNWITVRGNSFDFDETMLQGKYKVPSGMMLQGRKAQEKKQMVNLRKDFKNNIVNSRAAVRSISP